MSTQNLNGFIKGNNNVRRCSSLGRASDCQSEGRGIKTPQCRQFGGKVMMSIGDEVWWYDGNHYLAAEIVEIDAAEDPLIVFIDTGDEEWVDHLDVTPRRPK